MGGGDDTELMFYRAAPPALLCSYSSCETNDASSPLIVRDIGGNCRHQVSFLANLAELKVGSS